MLLQQPVSLGTIYRHSTSRSVERRRCLSRYSNRFEAVTGVRILEGYGLTESACVASFNPIEGERRIGSIGQALPWQKMKCVILDESGNHIRDAATG